MALSTVAWEAFQGKEDEANWLVRDKSFSILSEEIASSGTPSSLLATIRANYHGIMDVLHTPRTQLALSASKFVLALARTVGAEDFEPLSEATIKNLVRACGSTKKIIAAANEEALGHIFAISPIAKTLSAAGLAVQEKNPSLKERVVRSLHFAIKTKGSQTSLAKHWPELEGILVKAVCDASASVRSSAIDLLLVAESLCPIECTGYAACSNRLHPPCTPSLAP